MATFSEAELFYLQIKNNSFQKLLDADKQDISNGTIKVSTILKSNYMITIKHDLEPIQITDETLIATEKHFHVEIIIFLNYVSLLEINLFVKCLINQNGCMSNVDVKIENAAYVKYLNSVTDRDTIYKEMQKIIYDILTINLAPALLDKLDNSLEEIIDLYNRINDLT